MKFHVKQYLRLSTFYSLVRSTCSILRIFTIQTPPRVGIATVSTEIFVLFYRVLTILCLFYTQLYGLLVLLSFFFSLTNVWLLVLGTEVIVALDHTPRPHIIGRNPLDEWSARRRDLYMTIHNNYKRETLIPRRDSNPQSQQASDRRATL